MFNPNKSMLTLASILLLAGPAAIASADTASTTDNNTMGSTIVAEEGETTKSSSQSLFRAARALTSVANLSPTTPGLQRQDAIDISGYQNWMTQADFDGLKMQGVETVVVKLTEGTSYTNPKASTQIAMAKKAGLNVATYHYATFGNTKSQSVANNAAVAEAKYYASVAKKLGVDKNTIMIEDAENPYTSASLFNQASQKFAAQLKASGYNYVKYYTSKSWADSGYMKASTFGAKNIWVAQYLYGTPSTNSGWSNQYKNTSKYGALQYTANMRFTTTTNLKNNNLDTSVDYSNFFDEVIYKVSFNTMGGSTVTDQIVDGYGTATKPTNPTKSGYTFGGWYTESAQVFDYNFSTKVTGNKTLYAKWIPNGEPTVQVQAHVQNIGWQAPVYNGDLAGTSGKSLRVELLRMQLNNYPSGTSSANSGISYQAYVQDLGWQSSTANWGNAGTAHKAKRIESIKVNLTGEISKTYDVYYRVHVQDKGWTGWLKNGAAAGTTGQAKRLEGVQVKLVKKSTTNTDTNPNNNTSTTTKAPDIKVQAHVQNIGWQTPVYGGNLAGTSGKKLRVETLRMQIVNYPTGMSDANSGISYQAHVQNIGWQAAVSNGADAGTSHEAKRIESLRVNLTGEISKTYDVYYRVHIQDIGWTYWVKDGEFAGTTGMAKRLEGVEVKIIKKGDAAPTSTAKESPTPMAVYTTNTNTTAFGTSVFQGQASGNIGSNKGIQSIKLGLISGTNNTDGDLEYSSYIKNNGWQAYVSNQTISGTIGKNLTNEAFKIRLTGALAEKYDVYYQVYIKGSGWQKAVKNGEQAGITGQNKVVESIKVKIVTKGATAPF